LSSSQVWENVTVNPNTGRFVAQTTNATATYSDNGSTWTGTTFSSATTWLNVAGGSFSVFGNNGFTGLGLSSPAYQLDLSTDDARKLTTSTWLTGSDRRIKTDIVSANLAMCYETVKAIKLKYFKWTIPSNDQHSIGFIAQEVREVFPNVVFESNSFGYSDFLSLNTDQILKAMYGALQKTIQDIENLKARLAELQQRNKIPRLV